eukprot:TRINITY_DN9356_c0_g1_i1.p1 TRINITY_DN9356_c0_g1~~TRINITY_DN9356_c0_g1_i1.p1  ORF type:complete len:412 (+),score=108.57 TRINITY_DN9356_c0_g1_i1:147-1238(+)
MDEEEDEEAPPLPRHYYEQLKLPERWTCDMPSLGDEPTKDEKQVWKRSQILNEILQTETDYLRDLGVLVGLYLGPLQNEYSYACSQVDLEYIFSNVASLFEVTARLLDSLKKQAERPPEQQCIGQVFMDMMPDLKLYKIYCTNQKASAETVGKVKKSSADFEEFLRRVKVEHPENKNLDFEGQLIKPFQRIVRYSLLLKELCAATPKGWPDHVIISKALAHIELIVKQANEDKRMTDNILKVIEIQKCVSFQGEEVQLGDCMFMEEADLYVHEADAKRHVFLFHNLLLITKKMAKQKFKSTATIRLDSALVWDLPEAIAQQSKKRKFGFQVVGGSTPLTFVFTEEAAAETWRAKITECISVFV